MNFYRAHLFSLIFVILTSLFAYYLKSEFTGKEFFNADIFYIGNILTFSIIVLFVAGILLRALAGRKSQTNHNTLLFYVSILLIVPLFLVFVILKINLSLPDIYLLGLPFRKISFGFLFLVYEFLLFTLLGLIWSPLFEQGVVVYIKSIIFGLISLTALLFFSFIYTLNYSNTQIETLQNKENLAVVLGAAVWEHDQPSPIFKGRIEKSNQLYKLGIVKTIQVTGSNAPGELTEALTAFNYLISKGVDSTDILIEDNTSSTSEQIEFLRKNLVKYYTKYDNIILISDEFHLVRILEICKYLGVNSVAVASDYKLSWEKLLYYRVRESVALFLFWMFGI